MSILTGDWSGAIRLLTGMVRNSKDAIDMSVRDEAHYFTTFVNAAFVQSGLTTKWKKLSRIALEMRKNLGKVDPSAGSHGGSKPLIRSGDLRRSVNVKKEGTANYFVGVHRTATRKDGGPMVNVAEIHEYGRIIPVTDKLRGYFLYLCSQGVISAPLKASTKYLIIPARSYMADAMKKFEPGHQSRVMIRYNNYVMAGIGGLRGKVANAKPPKRARGPLGRDEKGRYTSG